MQEIISSI